MGCLRCCSLFTVILAVLLGTGIIPRALVMLGKKFDFEVLTGAAPICLTADEAKQASFDEIPDGVLNGKTCLVTGGNSGLGLSTCEQLAVKGCNVILAGRREDAIKTACRKVDAALKKAGSKGSCSPMKVDLADLKSVRAFDKAVLAKYDRLDVTVLNAGIANFWHSLELEKNKDGIEMNFATNHLGHFAMVQDLESLIAKTGREHGSARIVVVSSAAHYQAIPDVGVHLTLKELNDPELSDGLSLYGQSKLANVLMAQSLAKRLASDNVYVNSVHPGSVKTAILNPMHENVSLMAKKYPNFSAVFERLNQGIDWAFDQLLFSPEDGARTQVWLAASPEVEVKKITGKYFHPHAVQVKPSKLTERKANDQLLEDALWTFSEELLKGK